jgi:cytochrome P450
MSYTFMSYATLMDSFDETSPQQAYLDLTKCPMHGPGGNPIVAKRDEVLAVTRHPAVRANDGVHFQMGTTTPLPPLMIDGAEQKLFRKLLDPLFSPKAVEWLRPKVIELADTLIDEFIENGQAELYGAFCQPLPAHIFMPLLGLDTAQLPMFLRFKEDVVRPQGETYEEQIAYMIAAGDRYKAYIGELIDDREASEIDGSDLIAGFLRAEVDGRKLTRQETTDIIFLLTVAGLDTVAGSLSCMIGWLARNPGQRAELVANPSLLPAAVEELLRYESPVFQGNRYVTEDFEVNGRTFKAGEWLDVSWGGANMDPDFWENPTEVDFRRKHNAHATFAIGPHRCLGSNLARMELAAALGRFHERIPEYSITLGDAPLYNNISVRSAYHLPISFKKGNRVA